MGVLKVKNFNIYVLRYAFPMAAPKVVGLNWLLYRGLEMVEVVVLFLLFHKE